MILTIIIMIGKFFIIALAMYVADVIHHIIIKYVCSVYYGVIYCIFKPGHV